MRFFFLEEAPDRLEGAWSPPPELRQHLRALRFRAAEEFLLLLPEGGAVRAHQTGPDALELRGLAEAPRLELMPVSLATAWPKGKRAEDLVVRACEAGVELIQPIVFERSVAGREDLSRNQWQRLQRLARETCQQIGRPTLPEIRRRPISVFDAQEAAPAARPICLKPGAWSLWMELGLHSPQAVLLLVGPEGGMSPAEEEWLREQGWSFAALLPTILRIEAAGPLGAGLCQHWAVQLKER